MPVATPSGAFPPVRDRRSGRLTRRARNALRRRVLLASVAGGSFVAALLALVALPRRVTVVPPPAVTGERPDTTVARDALVRALARRRRAEMVLADARTAMARARAAAAPAASLTPEQVLRRDSLRARLAELTRLVQGAAAAPLPASYRALGESRALADSSRARALLDTLGAIERNRAAFGITGGADPIFVALSARAAEVGRELMDMAEARRTVLRRELARLAPPAPPAPSTPATDTLPLAAAAESAAAELVRARDALVRARAEARALEARAAAIRSAQNAAASPLAILAAALVIGIAAGYLAALAAELRRPTVSDPREAAAVAGVPLLVRAHEETVPPERVRREADRLLPPLLHRAADTYRVLYAQLADARANLPPIAIVGDDAGVTAAVAANLAAAASRQARTALLVDADLARGGISAVMRVRREPGLADVLQRRMEWPGALVSAPVGRDQSIDIIPAGVGDAAAGEATRDLLREERDLLHQEIGRMGRRYDAVVVSAPLAAPGTPPPAAAAAGQVVVCVRTARTPLGALRALMDALRRAELSVRGIVVWDSPDPLLAPALPAQPPASPSARTPAVPQDSAPAAS